MQPEGACRAQHSQRQRGHVGALCQRLRLLEAGAGYSQHLRFQLLGESLPGASGARSAGLAAAFCCLAPRSQFESLVNFAAVRPLGSPRRKPQGWAGPIPSWVGGGWRGVCVFRRGGPHASSAERPSLRAFGRREGVWTRVAPLAVLASQALLADVNPRSPEADFQHVRLGESGAAAAPRTAGVRGPCACGS